MNKVIWLYGLSGAGKTTLATAIHEIFKKNKEKTILLDGDTLRNGINRNLGFNEEDRNENVRRIAEVCKLMIQVNVTPIVSAITPYMAQRILIRNILGSHKVVLVFVKCPIQVCEERDVKQLYSLARRGIIKNFTGISDSFEEYTENCIEINTADFTIEESVNDFFNKLKCI